MARADVLRLLWSAVRRLPDGEEALRSWVGQLNDRDRTNQDALGTDEYTSTRRLTDAQLDELATEFRKKAKLPRKPPRPRGPRGGRFRRPFNVEENVSFLATDGERAYAHHLFVVLGFDDEKRESFIARQTQGRGMKTHDDVTRVVAPLESMCRRRGITITETGRTKTVAVPR